jgi:predicted secreted protein
MRSTHGRLLLAAVAAVAALGATAGTAAARTVKLTIADDGAHVKVHKGDTIAIRLASNQTTPFHWVAYDKPNPKVAKLTRARYVQGANPEGMAGAGGTQQYVIEATGTGATAFATQYQEISTGAPGSGRSDFVITITVTR